MFAEVNQSQPIEIVSSKCHINVSDEAFDRPVCSVPVRLAERRLLDTHVVEAEDAKIV